MKNLLRGWALLTLLTAFSAQSTTDQIVVWHQKDGASPLLESILRPVAEKHNQSISVTYIATNELKSALIKAVTNGIEPDLAIIPSDFFGEAKNFRPAQIPQSMQQLANLPDSTWQLARINDRVHGIPLFVGNAMMLYYNKRMIESPATSWEALVKQGSGLPESIKTVGWNYGELFWFVHFMTAFDAYPVTQNTVQLNTPQMQKALTFYRQLPADNVIDINCDYSCAAQRFTEGQFAYAINGDWAYPELKAQMGDSLGVTTLPSIDGTPMKSYYSAVTLVFPGKRKGFAPTDVLMELTQALLSEQAQLKLYSHHHLVPANPEIRAKITSTDADIAMLLAILDSAIPISSGPEMAAAWAGMRKGMDYFNARNVEAPRATMLMQRVAERQLNLLKEN